MNWLVISDDNVKTQKIKETLEKCFSGSNISCFKTSSKNEMLKVLPETTHAIILEDLSKDVGLSLAAGFLAGMNCSIYTTFSEIYEEIFGDGYFISFDDFEKLHSFIEEKKDDIVAEQREIDAYEYLYDNGFPFDSDNFARYIEKWKKKVCQSYVDAGMSVNSVDSDGTPMLNIAARSDNLAAVKWLLSNGADLNAISKDRGYSAVMDAVWRGNEEITSFLVKKGAELNTISKEGQTMLVLAVGADKTEIVRILAENGADPDIQDAMGMSAYGYAQLFKKEEILSILEKYHKEQ